jgi:hypothetical protein
MKYDYKLALNTIFKKNSMVDTFKQLLNPLIINLHPLSLLLLHIFQLHVYLLVILNLSMTFAKCMCKLQKIQLGNFDM